MKHKMITIDDDQDEWVDKKCLNFSKWVRTKLREEMRREELMLRSMLTGNILLNQNPVKDKEE